MKNDLMLVFCLLSITVMHASENQEILLGLGDIKNVRGAEIAERAKDWFRTNVCKEYFFELNFEEKKKLLDGHTLLIDEKILTKKNPAENEHDFEYYNERRINDNYCYQVIRNNTKSTGQVVQFFIQFPIDIQDIWGNTALKKLFNVNCSMLYDNYTLSRARFFVDRGANIDIANNAGDRIVGCYTSKRGLTNLYYSFLKFCVEDDCIIRGDHNFFVTCKNICFNCTDTIIEFLHTISDTNLQEQKDGIKALILYILKKDCGCVAQEKNKSVFSTEFAIDNEELVNVWNTTVRQADYFVVKLLIESGVDVNIKNIKGETALHVLARYSYCRNKENIFDVVYLLLENDARVDVPEYPYILKKNSHVISIPDYLAENNIEYLDYGTREEMRKERKKNGLRDNEGLEVLDYHEYRNYSRLVRDRGATCLDLFCEKGPYNVLELLLQYNNKLDESQKIYIPFEDICFNYGDAIFELLKKYGAIIGLENIHTGLIFHAVRNEQINIMSYLLENGYDCNITNRSGQHPLHVASANYHNREMTKLLLEHVADTCESSVFIERKIFHNDMINKIYTSHSILGQLYSYKWYDLLNFAYQLLDKRKEKSNEVNEALFPYYLQNKLYDKIVLLDLQYGFYDENQEYIFSLKHIINCNKYNSDDYPGYKDLASLIDWQNHYLLLLDNLISIYPDYGDAANDVLRFYMIQFFEAYGEFNPVFTFLMTGNVSEENKIFFIRETQKLFPEEFKKFVHQVYSFDEQMGEISAFNYVQEYYPDLCEYIV